MSISADKCFPCITFGSLSNVVGHGICRDIVHFFYFSRVSFQTAYMLVKDRIVPVRQESRYNIDGLSFEGPLFDLATLLIDVDTVIAFGLFRSSLASVDWRASTKSA